MLTSPHIQLVQRVTVILGTLQHDVATLLDEVRLLQATPAGLDTLCDLAAQVRSLEADVRALREALEVPR